MQKLKAYIVKGADDEKCTIAFAKTANMAKSFCYGTDSLSDSEYIELQPTRISILDEFAKKFGRGAVCWDSSLYRNAGCRETDQNMPACCKCRKYQFTDLPESQIDHVSDICQECISTSSVKVDTKGVAE